MRIKLKKGKQKELIYRMKNKYNFTWNEFSKFLKTSQSSLVEWSREKNLLPLNVYKKLDLNDNFKKFIVETKKDTWGRSKGGLNSKGSLKNIKIPKKSKELAELIGIILGDGNICSFKKGKKIRVYSIKIAGDLKKEKEYHINYIKSLFHTIFGIKASIQICPKNNEIFISLFRKKAVEFLESNGLKAGDKIKNKSTIPKWIFYNKEFLKGCIRGLIDTDGSIFRMSKKNPNLLRINFKNFNLTLLKDARKAFIELGFHPSKIICNNTFYISRKKEIKKYIKEVGFSNEKHLKRFQKFTSSPVL